MSTAIATTATRVPMLHIRYDGGSQDVPMNDLDVGDLTNDSDVRAAAANHLNVPATKLMNYAVDRNAETGDITLRPQAVFGSR